MVIDRNPGEVRVGFRSDDSSSDSSDVCKASNNKLNRPKIANTGVRTIPDSSRTIAGVRTIPDSSRTIAGVRTIPDVRLKKSKSDILRNNSCTENERKIETSMLNTASCRDGWWRSEMKNTPVPGRYEADDFLSELLKKPATYSFKSDGRKHDPIHLNRNGELLLPGAYQHESLVDRLKQSRYTYGFKNSQRITNGDLNYAKKNKDVISIGPGTYNYCEDNSIGEDKKSNKTWIFKSRVQRFPSIYFQPKEGPPPGSYDPDGSEVRVNARRSRSAPTRESTSSFASKTQRFRSACSKTPGPGTYDKTFQYPMPPTVLQMGRLHGIFFTSDFPI